MNVSYIIKGPITLFYATKIYSNITYSISWCIKRTVLYIVKLNKSITNTKCTKIIFSIFLTHNL